MSPGNFRPHDRHLLWIASLLRKEDLELLDSLKVWEVSKREAIIAANREFAKIHKNYFEYAYVWVEEAKHQP